VWLSAARAIYLKKRSYRAKCFSFSKRSAMGNKINNIPVETRKQRYLDERSSSITYNQRKHDSIACLLTRIRRSVEIAPRCGDHRVVDVTYVRIDLLLQATEWKLLSNELMETYGLQIGNLQLWESNSGGDDDERPVWELTFNLQRSNVEK
jgi:hypothetical protein